MTIILIWCFSNATESDCAAKSMFAVIVLVINFRISYQIATSNSIRDPFQALWIVGVVEQFVLIWPYFAIKLWQGYSAMKGLIVLSISIILLYWI